jgi:hypothetical protein
MPAYSFNPRCSANKGSVLAISLVILTAITLVSLTAMQRSGLQGKMVGSLQHNKNAFHTTESELEAIYDFYSSQGSATKALSDSLNAFTVGDIEQKDDSGNIIKDDSGNTVTKEEQEFYDTSTNHTSAYSTYKPTGSKTYPRLNLTSKILHTGVRNTLVEGFSTDSFVEYSFITTTISTEPNTIDGRELSSQTLGIKYIAPAG